MKKTKLLIAAALATVSVCGIALGGCSGIVKDPNPYSFTNPSPKVAAADAGMTIDGEFNEDCWKTSNWLHAVDAPAAYPGISADIDFTVSYGGAGVYFAMKVVETGNKIWVNPARDSFMNSSIEMYMGPIEDGGGSYRCFEFDFMADGSYSPKLNYNGWNGANTLPEFMPVVATKQLGGAVNTPECYGYQIEALFPWGFLEFADYDISDKDNMILGINPVHIFSFNYGGGGLDSDRKWSEWASKYIEVGWQNPSTFFQFGKNGLLCYDYTVRQGGSKKGIFEHIHGWDGYVLQQCDAKFVITPINGSKITKLTVGGEDFKSEIVPSSGRYLLTIPKATLDKIAKDGKFEIEIDFD